MTRSLLPYQRGKQTSQRYSSHSEEKPHVDVLILEPEARGRNVSQSLRWQGSSWSNVGKRLLLTVPFSGRCIPALTPMFVLFASARRIGYLSVIIGAVLNTKTVSGLRPEGAKRYPTLQPEPSQERRLPLDTVS